ncbi:MAG TPA: LpqB family beta-propeller domain-containing protein [Jatrophihabitans sp.]|nr:LpqB family beta-propeller domain-containing protein [Jatrophihabitans sp.]
MRQLGARMNGGPAGRPVTGLLAAVMASGLALAGCTTIPTSSSPEVVRSVPQGASSVAPRPNISPAPGLGPYDIVNDFLGAGVDADAGHSTARQFLTTAAARKWQDEPTVIVDETRVGDPIISGSTATVVVTGRRVGQLDASGVYTPTLKGMGTGDEEPFTYTLTRVAGQWRIDQLGTGVLISQSEFAATYRARRIYFFNSAGSILVPDLRYTPLEGQSLATWLLQQLLAGPRPELAQSVTNEVPDQVGKPSVQIGDPVTVEIPGSQNLDVTSRNGLAAQLAFTLGQAQFAELRLTDGGKIVQVPQVQRDAFSAVDFASNSPDNAIPGASVYFVRDGAVYDDTGTPLKSPLGLPARDLASVAVRRSGNVLEAAGVTVTGKLVAGDENRLSPIALPAAPQSRPEWAPQGDEIWVGVGSHGAIYRLVSGQRPRPVSVTNQTGGAPNGAVTAIRFSPDGARVAMVIRTPGGPGAVWVGSVVTSGSDVRIDSLELETPPRLSVSDLTWADPTKLLLIAAAPGAQAQLWDMLSDGSQLAPQSSVGLPGAPTAITAALQQNPVVSAGGDIFELSNGSWDNLGKSKLAVPGTNPCYAP